MEFDYSWIYLLIFLIFPLSRIIPRLLAKRRMKNKSVLQVSHESHFEQRSEETMQKVTQEIIKPTTKNMLVLGELNRGANTFEKILRNTGLEREELTSILEDLEKRGLMKVVQKQGLLGPKVELRVTEKGFKEFYS